MNTDQTLKTTLTFTVVVLFFLFEQGVAVAAAEETSNGENEKRIELSADAKDFSQSITNKNNRKNNCNHCFAFFVHIYLIFS